MIKICCIFQYLHIFFTRAKIKSRICYDFFLYILQELVEIMRQMISVIKMIKISIFWMQYFWKRAFDNHSQLEIFFHLLKKERKFRRNLQKKTEYRLLLIWTSKHFILLQKNIIICYYLRKSFRDWNVFC